MCTWAERLFPFLLVSERWVWNWRLDVEKNKLILECRARFSSQDDAKLNGAESLEFGSGWPSSIRFPNQPAPPREAGLQTYMATLATWSSSLAIRRSWRMTRSLSDLNSRSTSSSLSSIFWSFFWSETEQSSFRRLIGLLTSSQSLRKR